MASKAASAANMFISVPFVLHALGPEQFGVWATLVSLVVFAGFLDFGFGNGAMNLVAAAHGRGASVETGSILREGTRMLSRVALWLMVAVLVALPLVPWHRLLGMPEAMASASRTATAVVLFAIVLTVPLNLAIRAQLGLGRGERAFRWQAAGQLLTLIVVITLAKMQASLAALTAAAVVTPLLSSVVNTILLWREPEIVASAQAPRRYEIGAQIRREGLLFFVLQISAALAFSADLPLIAASHGPTEAGNYSIVQRLFSIVPMGLSLVWVPLWPIYRQALAAGDHAWVVRTLRRSVLFAVLVACACAAMLVLGFDHLVALWVHRPLAASGILLAGFALWCVIDAIGTAIATFLNAAGILRFQVVIAIILAIVVISAKALVLKAYAPDLLPWVTIIAYVAISLIPTLLSSKALMRRALAPG